MSSQTVIVVPCFNEAHRLPVDEFRKAAAQSATGFLFVDDGSRDGTFDVLEELRQWKPEMYGVLRLDRNRGKAEAVRQGMLKALESGPAYVGYWDADLATPLSAVEDLRRILESHPGAQMVFGSRVKLLGRHIERRAIRHYLGRVFATVADSVLGVPVYDSQCGAKLFRATPATQRIFSEPFLTRWIFDVEIIARVVRQKGGDRSKIGDVIIEAPLDEWRDVAGSKVRPTDFFKAIYEIGRIHQKYLRDL